MQLYRKLRFLVTDDFENFRKSLRQMLRSFGAEKIDMAANGNETIAKCANEPFDVLICDYNLGSGKNGQQTLEALRHQGLLKHTALFAIVTAETSREIVMSAREYRPDTYIIKPITQAVLKKRLDALIDQRQALLPINQALDQGDEALAVTLCKQQQERQPRYRNAIRKIQAELHCRLGEYEPARAIYQQVLANRELAWARLGLGQVALAASEPDEAISEFETLIENNPDFVEAYDYLARALRMKGQDRQAQKVLEQAVELSPLAILRQRDLAEVAGDNQDMETAAGAWRATVKLSDNSVHDSPENYLGLSRCLTELSDGEDSPEGRRYADEALTILRTIGSRFKEDDDAELLRTLVAARVYAGQQQPDKGHKLLNSVSEQLNPETLTADQGLEYARALYALKDPGKAQGVLNKLAERFEKDKPVMEAIEALMDEPVSFQQKRKARALNREGISAFEEGRLDEAAEAFNQALALVPQHPALNLNLVQVLLKNVSQGESPDASLLKRCQSCLDQLAHLPPQHRQYKRFRHLQERIQSLRNRENTQ
ncbi:MAG: tetratricopeptide repeat protein [Oleiphilaceae bacterium]|nr:tetratricopeptide repeat protein [Oleiphilaceae bacterium]